MAKELTTGFQRIKMGLAGAGAGSGVLWAIAACKTQRATGHLNRPSSQASIQPMGELCRRHAGRVKGVDDVAFVGIAQRHAAN